MAIGGTESSVNKPTSTSQSQSQPKTTNVESTFKTTYNPNISHEPSAVGSSSVPPASSTTTTTHILSPSGPLSSSADTQSHTIPSPLPPPAVTITPASPGSTPVSTDTARLANPIEPPTATASTTMKEKGNQPTDSEIALLTKQNQATNNTNGISAGTSSTGTSSNGEPSKGSSLTNLTRRLSGRGGAKDSKAPEAAGSTTIASDNEASKEKPSITTPATTAKTLIPDSRQPAPSASKPAAASSSTQRASQKKKKKRKGLAGFLLTLGCLSADEFEEDSKKVKATQTTQKPGTSVTTASATAKTTSTPTTKKVDEIPTVAVSSGHQADATGTTGTTLVDAAAEEDKGDKVADKAIKPKEEVVVAPAEPHTLPVDETAGVTSSAVQAPGGGSALLGTPTKLHPHRPDSEHAAPSSSAEAERTETSGGYTDISNSDIADESTGAAHEDGVDEYGLEEDDEEDEEDRLIEQGGMGIPLDENGHPAPLLPPILKEHHGRKCLVLDLDETLLHSSFKSLPSADYIVPVEIESQIHNVYVIKRPGVDHFLKEMGKIYEIVVFTASLSKYADPVLDMLDTHRVVTHRLFRESCYNHKGNYVKDLSQLGRSIDTSIIIDNSPASYIFHPNNAVPVSTWFNDPHDTELTDLCPFLTDLATVDDVRGVLDGRLF
ncbi:hypothetical protein I317_07031 [Kwoniella heveanensis CBS 569]|nr:hypothetical protein I317_07031 [Kwoniella heveanensis CBS 569]